MNETKKTPEKRRAASIRENAAATTAGTEKEASGKQEVSVPALREPAEKNKAEKNKSEEKRKNKKNKDRKSVV